MMDSFRKFGATRVSKAMLLLLVVSFGAWGIGGYLMPSLGAAAITVNGEGISPQTLEQTYKQRLENISQLLGSRPTQEQIDQMQLPEQVVTEVVARTVLRQSAENLGMLPATKQLQDEIMMVSAFKNEKGQFDVGRYRQILQQVGRTPQQFEMDLGQDIKVRQLAQLSKVELPDPKLVGAAMAAENAALTLEVATFSPASLPAVAEPTANELEAFYKDNAQVYSKPETRDLTVLRISREEITKSISVPEKDIKEAYDANKAHYALPEMRVVRHILLDSREEAERVAKGITDKASFEAAANKDSKDPGNQGKGGTLGRIEEKDVVPAFGKAAFKLPVNTLSAPVQSNFGWHLIWVDSIEPAKALSFEETKDAIAKDLQAAQADDALVRLSGQADERIAAGEPLAKIASALGLKAHQFNMVKSSDEGVEPQELEAGFSLNQGEISVPLPMKDGGVAYVQATEVRAASVQPLNEVRARVSEDFKKAKTQSMLRENAEKLLASAKAAKGQGDLQSALAAAGVPGKMETVRMTDAVEAPNWLQRSLLEVYPLPQGGVLGTPLQDGESWHVVRLAGRSITAAPESELPQMAKVFQQRLQGDLEALLMSYLTQQAKVKIHQDHIKQLFGREVRWDMSESR